MGFKWCMRKTVPHPALSQLAASCFPVTSDWKTRRGGRSVCLWISDLWLLGGRVHDTYVVLRTTLSFSKMTHSGENTGFRFGSTPKANVNFISNSEFVTPVILKTQNQNQNQNHLSALPSIDPSLSLDWSGQHMPTSMSCP